MKFTHKIDEELDKIFIYDERGCRVGFGSLMEDGINCSVASAEYLEKERKKYRKTSLKYAQFKSDKYKNSVDELHNEYFKSLEKLEKFEQKVIELKKTHKETKSPREILMNKAKKMFPIGTKFTSIFGADDEIVDTTHYWNDEKDCILAHCKRESRMIYDGHRWADVYK